MTKIVIGVVAAVAVAGGAWYWTTNMQPPAQDAKVSVAWQFTSAEEVDAVPYTNVAVVINGTVHEVGSYQGSCAEVGATGGVDGKGLLAGELSAAQCWFAGGGDEIGVFANEDGGLDLMVGGLSEGIEGGESFRGDFKIKEGVQL